MTKKSLEKCCGQFMGSSTFRQIDPVTNKDVVFEHRYVCEKRGRKDAEPVKKRKGEDE